MNREEKKPFLEQLQSLDPQTKKKVLVTTTVIVLVLVTYVWLGYFNNIIADVSASSVADVSAGPASAQSEGLWGRMQSGAAFVYGEVNGALQDLFGLFGAPKQYTVTPNQ